MQLLGAVRVGPVLSLYPVCDVAFKRIGSDDHIFLCAKCSQKIHKTRARATNGVLISQVGAVLASPVCIEYPPTGPRCPDFAPSELGVAGTSRAGFKRLGGVSGVVLKAARSFGAGSLPRAHTV